VRDLKLADLAGVRLKTRDGAVTDERIPTFAQVLDSRGARVGRAPARDQDRRESAAV